jgi:hypothetical protein
MSDTGRVLPPATSDTPNCELCGEPMPAGEEMFKYHGYSGPCPKPPLPPQPVGPNEQAWRDLQADGGLPESLGRQLPANSEWVFIHEAGEWRCHCGYRSTSWDTFVGHFSAPPRNLLT